MKDASSRKTSGYGGYRLQYAGAFQNVGYAMHRDDLNGLSDLLGHLRQIIHIFFRNKDLLNAGALGCHQLFRQAADGHNHAPNLASKEYSKCIEKYLIPQDRYITVTFCELSGDKLVTKGTYAKMARGEMVRFMAENNIENPVEIQKFDRLGYFFRSDLSSATEYVFERKIE